jgi:hypothetical protein
MPALSFLSLQWLSIDFATPGTRHPTPNAQQLWVADLKPLSEWEFMAGNGARDREGTMALLKSGMN